LEIIVFEAKYESIFGRKFIDIVLFALFTFLLFYVATILRWGSSPMLETNVVYLFWLLGYCKAYLKGIF